MKVKGMFLFNNSTESVAILVNTSAIWKRSKLLAAGFKYMGKAIGNTDQEVADNARDQLNSYYPEWITYDELMKG
jgi:hypothetical protein